LDVYLSLFYLNLKQNRLFFALVNVLCAYHLY